jgi:hypothetical protein
MKLARHIRAPWVVTVASAFFACATENVMHSVRGPGYPGYAVEYVDAVPGPGTRLTEGDSVDFTITVRYVLQTHDTGMLELLYRNERDVDVLPPGGAIPIKRDRWQRATLRHTVRIPRGVRELYVTVPVVLDGATTSSGMLRIRYPVAFRK